MTNIFTDDELESLLAEIEPQPAETVEPQQSEPSTIKPKEELSVSVDNDTVTPKQLKQNIELKPSQSKESEEAMEKKAKYLASLNHKPDILAFQQETVITESTLDKCMIEQSALSAYYSAQYAQAEAQSARLKTKFETLEAGLYDAYRKHLTAIGEKTTEKAVENAVRMDKQWVQAKMMLIEAQMYAETYKGFVSSLRDRCSILMQLGADRREQLKGSIRTMMKEDEDELLAKGLESVRRALNN